MKRLFALVSMTLLTIGILRCYQVPETLYGDPSGLKSGNLPGEAGVAPLMCDGGDDDAAPIKKDASGCPSWATDIYPNMQPMGDWQCSSSSCHGGPNTPPISPTSAMAAYTSLMGYTGPTGATYVNPASSDPTKSQIVCNLTGTCGQGMPLPPGKQLTCTQLETVTTWVRCGSPP